MNYYPIKIKRAFVVREQENSIIHQYKYNVINNKVTTHYSYNTNLVYSGDTTFIMPDITERTINTEAGILPFGKDITDEIVSSVSGKYYSNNSLYDFSYTVFNSRKTGTTKRIIKIEGDTIEYEVDVYSSGYDYVVGDTSGTVLCSSVAEDEGSPSTVELLVHANLFLNDLIIYGNRKFYRVEIIIRYECEDKIYYCAYGSGQLFVPVINTTPPNPPYDYNKYEVIENTIVDE